MNQRNIDALIPVVVNYLTKTSNVVVKDNKVTNKEYSSYLASFGPTIIQAGMMKALAVYGRRDNESKRYVIDGLVKTILIAGNVIDCKYVKYENMIDVYLEIVKGLDVLSRLDFEDRILEAIIACKLAIQLFKIEKK